MSPPPVHAAGLRLEGLTRRFGALTVLDGVSLELAPGERMALIGPNGAGKTTLFNLLCGSLAPSAGRAWLDTRVITGLPPWRVARQGLGRSFQISSNFARLSVTDNLRVAALRAAGLGPAFWRRLKGHAGLKERSEAALEAVGLAPRRDALAATLSYAEQRALEVGMVLAGAPRVLLLDEPTAGMSRAEAEAMTALIARVATGRSLLLIEHDMSVVFGIARRIAVLERGRLLAVDTPERIRADARVRRAYLGDAEDDAEGDAESNAEGNQ